MPREHESVEKPRSEEDASPGSLPEGPRMRPAETVQAIEEDAHSKSDEPTSQDDEKLAGEDALLPPDRSESADALPDEPGATPSEPPG